MTPSRRVRNIRRIQARHAARPRPRGPAWLHHPYLVETVTGVLTVLIIFAVTVWALMKGHHL